MQGLENMAISICKCAQKYACITFDCTHQSTEEGHVQLADFPSLVEP